jgi:lipoprotein-anchoring transpeptidase ErfK/SrfK
MQIQNRAPDPYIHSSRPPASYPARPRRRRSSRYLGPLILLAGTLVAIGLLLAAFFSYYAYFQITHRILPGVYVGQVDLSGMDLDQAAIELQKTWNLERRLVVTEGLHNWSVPPDQLGLSIDPLWTARDALAVGHGQSFLEEVSQMVYSLRRGWGVAPRVNFDPVTAAAGLEALSNVASLAPKDAGMRLEGTELVAIPGELGYTVNIEQSLAVMKADPRGVLIGGRFKLVLKPVPPQIEDVSQAMAEAQQLLDSTVSLRLYDPISNEFQDWPVSREDIAGWMVVNSTMDGPQLGLEPDRVQEYLSAVSAELGPQRKLDTAASAALLAESFRQGSVATLIVKHNPTRYTVQPGDTLLKIGWNIGVPFWMILQANPDLDPDSLYAGQEITIPSKDDLLPLPVVINKRIVISIGKQRLWVYENGQQIAKQVISTGIDRSPTQPGVFQVQTHELNAYASVWDLYMPHFLGVYEAWPGFMNGIHGLPTLSSGRRLWANILGKPASYGCIILDLDAAEWLYNWAENGVIVEIVA